MNDFILYSYFRSSASYRVRIALNLKEIPYEYRAVHLVNQGGEQNQPEYRELNPAREVPTLVHKGRPLAQSMAIIDYLDRVKPTPKLFPDDPYLRGLVVQACEIINSGVQPLHNLRVLQELEKSCGAGPEKKNEWAKHWVRHGLDTMESFLKDKAASFSFGNDVSAADCFLIPHLANADRFEIPLQPYPVLSRIRATCEALEAFQKASIRTQPDTPANF